MYFRIKTDAIVHARNVYSALDWLGSIGGVEDLLVMIAAYFFGGYLQFNAVLSTLNSLRVVDPDQKKDEDGNIVYLGEISSLEQD